MGPRLARRGIGSGPRTIWRRPRTFNGSTARSPWYRHGTTACWSRTDGLQWVHGSLAVVSVSGTGLHTQRIVLQWVHGSLAVVSHVEEAIAEHAARPSMGPRLARRGIVQQIRQEALGHQPSMGPRLARRGIGCSCLAGRAGCPPSMGPRLARRGIGDWPRAHDPAQKPSMGPRLARRGIVGGSHEKTPV